MKITIQTLMKARGAWHSFCDNHPTVMSFLKDVGNKGIREGVQFEVIARYPDGTELKSDIDVRQSDMPFFDILKDLL